MSWSERVERFSDGLGHWAEGAGQWAGAQWLVALVLAYGLLLSSAAVAPVLTAAGAERAARVLYWAFGHICHQDPGRSLWIAGQPMALCARDIGVYGGIWLGMALYAIGRGTGRSPAGKPLLSGRLALLCALPLILDGGTQLVGWRESTNLLRVLTGALAGVALALYLLPKVGIVSADRRL